MVIRLDEAFSKGSAKILQNKNLVKSLADSIRADVDDNPNFFPRNAVNTFPRMQDAQLAEWFLGELDRMEQEGYEGTKLTSDGSINDWVVKKYISGAHTWEDLTGKLQQQLHNWVNLKKFGLLKPEHQNIPSFNGVLDLGKYMVGHYSNEMKELQNEIKKAALKKKAKSAVIVNNDDYKIYVTLNRAANQLTGANTTWCTTSSATDSHWNSYSNQAMLFQLFPKDAEFVSLEKEGRDHPIEGAERYQFGADSGYSFMDIADHRYPAEKVRERWPYLWDDLKSALQQQAGKLEGIMKALSEDPHMQDPDVKIKTYKIQTEINKLEKFKNRGYFTDEVRPAVEPEQEQELKAAADSGQEQPKLNPPAEGQPQMESIKELARMMIEGRLNEFDPAGAPPNQPPKLPPKEPDDHWGDEDDSEEDHPRNYFYLTMSHIEVIKSMYKSIGDPDPVYGVNDKEEIARTTEQYKAIPKIKQLADIFENSGVGAGLKFYLTLPQSVKESLWYSWDGHGLNVEQDCKKFGLNYDLDLDEDSELDVDEELDVDAGADATGGDLGSMGAGAGPSGGGQYPPGTAPTMPESFNNKGTEIMENVDKDVAAMLKSLKKYDRLVESCAPVLMARPKPYVGEGWDEDQAKKEKLKAPPEEVNIEEEKDELEEEGNPWEKLGKDEKKDEKKDGEKSTTSKGGEVTKTKTGLVHKGKYGEGDKKEKVEEGADPEVLEWMNRFSKLGNMKGYGR